MTEQIIVLPCALNNYQDYQWLVGCFENFEKV